MDIASLSNFIALEGHLCVRRMLLCDNGKVSDTGDGYKQYKWRSYWRYLLEQLQHAEGELRVRERTWLRDVSPSHLRRILNL